MRIQKKISVLAGLIFLSVVTAGCGGEDNTGMNNSTMVKANVTAETAANTQTKTETINTPKPIVEEVSAADSLITKAGGLGDTKEAIEQVRGADENDGNDGISSYQDKTFLVMYSEDDVTKKNTANNVTVSFEATDTPRRSVEEALSEASAVIPSDAIKIKEYVADAERDVVQYESKLLADRLKGYYDFAVSLDPDLKPGTFIVILKRDDQGIFSVVIGAGSNP